MRAAGATVLLAGTGDDAEVVTFRIAGNCETSRPITVEHVLAALEGFSTRALACAASDSQIDPFFFGRHRGARGRRP